VDTGLLILRVVVGLLFVGHGTQKLFGWFRGYGLKGTGGFFEQLGYRPGPLMAGVAGSTETVGGLLLATGLFTPLAAAMVIGTMINAIVTVQWPNGLWNGYEKDLVFGTVATALAFVGPGMYSLDDAFGWTLAGTDWGLAAIGLGALTATLVLASRRKPKAVAVAVQQAA
jgi:putative oxidoreductase